MKRRKYHKSGVTMNSKNKKIVDEVANKIVTGDIQPWKVEKLLLKEYKITSPEQYRLAALSRRKVIGDSTGYQFNYLEMPDKPYLMKWRCPKDGSIWHLEARDMDTILFLLRIYFRALWDRYRKISATSS